MKAAIAMTAIALVTLGAAQVAAQARKDPEAPRTTIVSYADLNLHTAGGRAALEGRIDAAVVRVCLDRPEELARQEAWSKCRQTALDSAHPQLAAILNGRNFANASVQVTGTRR